MPCVRENMEKQLAPEVLVVEDQPLTRMAAADAITDLGAKVQEAGDAGEALNLLSQHPQVGLLFTDVDLPGDMNGLLLAEKVHSERPDVELIVTSGHIQIADKDLPDHGTFLPKPYRAERLQNLVKDKLRSRSG